MSREEVRGSPRSKVLVVDDERSIRVTLSAMLGDAGYEVEAVETADRALQLLSRSAWDVVLTDIVLPGGSGVNLLKSIRAAAPDVQVIMMTGDPSVATATAAVRAGARDYLTKPVLKNALLRSVATAAAIHEVVVEKRRLEAENHAHQENLENLVAERTEALQEANRKLEEAMADVRRTHEEVVKQERLSALGQMVSGIAHDFNNALMPIVGLSSYFLTDSEALKNPDQLRADLEAIRTSASAAADIVRRLREFYKPDEDLGATSVNLGELVTEVLRLTAPSWKAQAEAEGSAVRVENAVGDLPEIPANEARLRDALMNLVLNAVAAMPEGGTLRLEAEVEPEAVCLRIADSGVGMPEDVRRRCFEPFFTTKGKQGSGLGLAMVHGIVTRHGGEIAVESSPGEGTTFTVRLPRARETSEKPAASARETPDSSAGSASAYRILVVDDEDWARNLVGRFLELKGHTIFSAASGSEALALLRRETVELVITDRAMPDMSGDLMAVEVKRMMPGAPVIMLTGFGDMMEVQDEKPDGVDYVLAKPVTPDQLHAAVARAMGGMA